MNDRQHDALIEELRKLRAETRIMKRLMVGILVLITTPLLAHNSGEAVGALILIFAVGTIACAFWPSLLNAETNDGKDKEEFRTKSGALCCHRRERERGF